MRGGTGRSSLMAPEEIARRLLGLGAGENQSPEALATTAEQAFLQLRAALVVYLGSKGFDSLWARAMLLARLQLQAEGLEGGAVHFSSPEQWADAASRHDASEVCIILNAQLASFIGLLFTFIGEELGLRLLRPALPEAPPHEEATPIEDAPT